MCYCDYKKKHFIENYYDDLYHESHFAPYYWIAVVVFKQQLPQQVVHKQKDDGDLDEIQWQSTKSIPH